MAGRNYKMLEQAPLPQLIQSLGKAIAQAQFELDKNVLQALTFLSDPKEGIVVPGTTEERSLLALGFVPSFYHFSEATITAKVAFSSAQAHEFSFGAEIGGGVMAPPVMFFASVNASYSGKYSFRAEGSSEVTTKIVSLPPPAPLNDLLSDFVGKQKNSS